MGRAHSKLIGRQRRFHLLNFALAVDLVVRRRCDEALGVLCPQPVERWPGSAVVAVQWAACGMQDVSFFFFLPLPCLSLIAAACRRSTTHSHLVMIAMVVDHYRPRQVAP